MSGSQRGLGRGLDALFKGTRESVAATDIQKVLTSSLQPNPQQPRRHFAEGQLEELAASIKSQGVLQPVVVRPIAGTEPPKYEIVAGERRWRASTLAGLLEIPVVIKELSDQETLVIALMENLQREDLTILEEAQGLQQLKDEFGLSQEDLAQKLGKSRSTIANTLRLLTLPAVALEDLKHGRITAGHARSLLTVTDETAQEMLRCRIVAEHMNVRGAEACAAIWKETGILPAATDILATPPRKEGRGAKNKPVSEVVQRLEKTLGVSLDMPVTISGGDSKGSIRIAYGSKQELVQLLRRLGVDEEGV